MTSNQMAEENLTVSTVQWDFPGKGFNSSLTGFSENFNSSLFVNYSEYLRQMSFLVVFPLFLIGVLGNMTTIIVILYKNYHNRVTFTAIMLLAVADLIALIIRLLSIRLVIFDSTYIIIISCCIFTSIILSNLHVIILFRLRCLLIVQPLQSLSIRPVDIMRQSGIAWILSVICGIVCIMLSQIRWNYPAVAVNVVLNLLLCQSVLVPTLFYHCKKVKALKVSPNRGTMPVVQKMNAVIAAIVTIQIIAWVLTPISRIIFLLYGQIYHLSICLIVGEAIYMFNYAVNPIIYFFSIVYGTAIRSCKNALHLQH